jgi:N6-adenosine-specific RNA methylase IME4
MSDTKKYQTLVVDPPWRFQRQSEKIRPHYDLMDLESIKRFPIQEMAAEQCHLYLWTPNAFISEAHEIMKVWGFNYKTMIVWVKHQMGVGNYYRNSTEPILFGVRGRLPPLRRNARTWFLADRHQHSRKPDEFFRLVESMSPGPRIDVFSREKRPGWDQLGNQCTFFNQPQGDPNERKQIVETDGSRPLIGRSLNDVIRLD